MIDPPQSRGGVVRQCANCVHWDEGDCLAVVSEPLPFWVQRRKEWTFATDGTNCATFRSGKHRSVRPDRARRSRSRRS